MPPRDDGGLSQTPVSALYPPAPAAVSHEVVPIECNLCLLFSPESALACQTGTLEADVQCMFGVVNFQLNEYAGLVEPTSTGGVALRSVVVLVDVLP